MVDGNYQRALKEYRGTVKGGADPKEEERLERDRRIVEMKRDNPDMSQREIAAAVGVSGYTVNMALKST